MRALRIVVGCLLVVWLGQLAYQAWDRLGGSEMLFPGASYPAWVATGAAILVAAHLGLNIAGGRGAAARALSIRAALLPAEPSRQARYGAFIATWLVYVLALPALGFVASTVLALSASVMTLARFPVPWVLVCSAVFVVVLKILFITVFYISLPAGFLDEFIVEIVYRLRS